MPHQQQQQYVETFSALRENQALTAYDLHNWFRLNTNRCCRDLSGRAGRQLDQGLIGGMYAVFIKKYDNKLFARLDLAWYYDKGNDDAEERPQLELLAGFLPNVERLKMLKQLPNALRAELTLDLQIWRNYAASLLGSYLYESWVNPHRDVSVEEEMQRAAALILAHVYPNVKLDFLRVAVDLGMVSKNPALFTSWFHQYLSGVDRGPVTLSSDFDSLLVASQQPPIL